jgi:hypothetical protein
MTRQHFYNLIRTFTENAIGHDDAAWGRQLATMFEKYSLILRAHYGGKPKWAADARTYIKARRDID